MVSSKSVFLLLALLSLLALLQSIRLLADANQQDGISSTPREDHAFNPVNLETASMGLANYTANGGKERLPPNRLIHLAIFGLGHRLTRTTTAWHLAKKLKLAEMKFLWGTCGDDHATGQKIFPHLFGDDILSLPSTEVEDNGKPVGRGKEILVRNDVYGYVPGQDFKDLHLPLSKAIYHDGPQGPFMNKLESDVQLYKILRDRYVYKDQVISFMKKHKFSDHTVLGVHLRVGNGEKTHFEYSGRGVSNEMEFVSNFFKNIVPMFIQKTQISYPARFSSMKPPLIFLATDTASLVPSIVNYTESFGVKTAVLPQIRVKEKGGVTFKALQGAGTKCLEGWQAMFSDMLLLSHADVLIATRHSSFTQSLPISLVFDRTKGESGPHFCEVSDTALSMVCLEDLATWLFRDDGNKIVTYVVNNEENGNDTTQEEEVIHKLLVHLPDIEPAKEFAHAVEFLNGKGPDEGSLAITHTYGAKRFNPKYRLRNKGGTLPSWNLTAFNN